jgi:glycosyltransferase involved in cell wall biosynthesis
MNLAYFSPLPPDRTGIASYSRELLPYLGKWVKLTLFADDPAQVEPDLGQQFAIEPVSAYPARRGAFDLTLYQMGNSRWHETIYATLRRFPGVVVLHDVSLHHFMADRAARRGDYGLYTREMGYAGGLAGACQAWAIQAGREEYPLFDIPLNERLIHASLGIIVHSDYARDQVAMAGWQRPLAIIPLVNTIARQTGQSRRATLNLPADAVILSSFGQINATRQLDMALTAFGQLAPTMPNLRYLLVGGAGDDIDLPGMIARCGAPERVITAGYAQTETEFVDWLATADLVINLRYPTVGETSSVAVQAMAAGKPLIVFDHGTYAELPDAACRKIAPMNYDGLLAAMRELAQSATLRQEMGAAGAAYAAHYHDTARIASQYAQFLRQILANVAAKFNQPGQSSGENDVV